jgi:hypothetical protein
VSEWPQMRLATEEDLERVLGSERLLIGFPVRPTSEDELEDVDSDVEHDSQ